MDHETYCTFTTYHCTNVGHTQVLTVTDAQLTQCDPTAAVVGDDWYCHDTPATVSAQTLQPASQSAYFEFGASASAAMNGLSWILWVGMGLLILMAAIQLAFWFYRR